MKRLKIFLKYFLSWLVILSLLFLLFEVGLRLFNVNPYYIQKSDIEVFPDGKFVQKDSFLGFKHLSGKFEIILKQKHRFTTTHDSTGLRITRQPGSNSSSDGKSLDEKRPVSSSDFPSLDEFHERKNKLIIWLMGCSVTHGWGVNDSETLPWTIQSEMPDYEVVNWGVSAYGTLHSLIQLEQNLNSENLPETLVLCYGRFHQMRNVFSKQRRRQVMYWSEVGSLNQPYGDLDSDGKLVIRESDKLIHTLWRGAEKSRVIYYTQALIENISDFFDNRKAVTEAILLKMKGICDQHNIRFVIANIEGWKSDQIENFCAENQIEFVDISWEKWDEKYTNFPYDDHPNAEGHRLFARKLIPFLREKLKSK